MIFWLSDLLILCAIFQLWVWSQISHCQLQVLPYRLLWSIKAAALVFAGTSHMCRQKREVYTNIQYKQTRWIWQTTRTKSNILSSWVCFILKPVENSCDLYHVEMQCMDEMQAEQEYHGTLVWTTECICCVLDCICLKCICIFLFLIVYLDDSTRILFYLCTEYCCSWWVGVMKEAFQYGG